MAFAAVLSLLSLIVAANLRRGFITGRMEYGHFGFRRLFANRAVHPRGFVAAVMLNVFCLAAFLIGLVQSAMTLIR